MSDRHIVCTPPLKEVIIVLVAQVIRDGAIGEVVKGGLPRRVVAGIKACVARDGAEFANGGISGARVRHDVTVSTHLCFHQRGAGPNAGPRTQDTVADMGFRRDTRFRVCLFLSGWIRLPMRKIAIVWRQNPPSEPTRHATASKSSSSSFLAPDPSMTWRP